MRLVVIDLPIGTKVRHNSVTSNGQGVDGYWEYGIVKSRFCVGPDDGTNGGVMLQYGCVIEEIKEEEEVEPMSDIIQANYDVYAKYISMFTGYSVKDLREIAVRMNIVGRSTMKKGELVHAITLSVLSWADEAFRNAEQEVTYNVPDSDIVLTGMNARIMIEHMRNIRRFNPTLKRDKEGVVILTPKQQKRVHKKLRSFGRKVGLYA